MSYATDRMSHSSGFEQREKVATGRLTFIHFKEKIELVMDLDTFQRLNLFVAANTPATERAAVA
jgi:hypothetical protein